MTDASSAVAYLAGLPADRRETVQAVRDVILRNLPDGFEEGILYGMISYYVPLERYPNTYNGQPLTLASLASQKNHVALYLNSVYADPATDRWFRDRYAESGKKLDMGKSCVRFRRASDLPLDLIGETIARVDAGSFVRQVEAVQGSARKSRARR